MKTQEKESGYQGWTNYETWCVKLWIDNEEASYDYWRAETKNVMDRCEDKYPNQYWDLAENRRFMLADILKNTIDEEAPLSSGMYADLMGAALSEVNWNEIAQAMIDDEIENRKG